MRIELGDYTILDKGKDNRNITKYLLEMLVDNMLDDDYDFVEKLIKKNGKEENK